jgi:hypothetical protein
MYTTTRDIVGGTLMTSKDCGHAVSMDKICETPLQSATDMLKHMAAHNASGTLAPFAPVISPEVQAVPLEAVLFVELPLKPSRLRPNLPTFSIRKTSSAKAARSSGTR